jgi:hypothetical protein
MGFLPGIKGYVYFDTPSLIISHKLKLNLIPNGLFGLFLTTLRAKVSCHVTTLSGCISTHRTIFHIAWSTLENLGFGVWDSYKSSAGCEICDDVQWVCEMAGSGRLLLD